MTKWKSLYIYFISGTGNAKASSEWIRDEAEKAGLRTVVQQIDRLENIQMPDRDEKPLIGFAFPTHGFNAAPIMITVHSRFPQGSRSGCFLTEYQGRDEAFEDFLARCKWCCTFTSRIYTLVKRL